VTGSAQNKSLPRNKEETSRVSLSEQTGRLRVSHHAGDALIERMNALPEETQKQKENYKS
jgi:hypothetical protein